MATLGDRMKELREMMGISQAALARKAKVSQPTVSDYESGKKQNYRATTLMKLSAALDTTPEYLLRGTGPKLIEDAATDEQSLLEAFRGLDESSRYALIAAAQAMKKTK